MLRCKKIMAVGGRRRRLEAQGEAQYHARGNIKGDCDPGSPHGLTENFVDNHDVDERVIDLDQFERLRRSRRRARTDGGGDVLAILEAADSTVPKSGGDGIAAGNGEGGRFAPARAFLHNPCYR